VPFDFELGRSWIGALAAQGFDTKAPALVASTGVAQYIGIEALRTTMQQTASLASGTCFVCSFVLRAELIDPAEVDVRAETEAAAAAGGHPWVSTYAPSEIAALAREAGFRRVEHVSSSDLERRYFANRADDLRPSSSEALIIAFV